MYLNNLFLICLISARRAFFLLTGIASNWPGIIFFNSNYQQFNSNYQQLFLECEWP